ncbi:MAG: polysaccharide biosynthesis tyrosine autokinase [Pseudomonadota bacterium]
MNNIHNNLTQPSFNIQSTNIQQESVDLREYFAILLRYKWGIILVCTILPGIVALAVKNMESIYSSTASIMIETQKSKVVSIEELYGIDTENETYLNSQVDIILSRTAAEKVVDKLDLINNPTFNPPPKAKPTGVSLWLSENFSKLKKLLLPTSTGGESKVVPLSPTQIKNELVIKLLKQLSISFQKKSQLVEISFESKSPELAAEIVMAIIKVYIDGGYDAKSQMTQKATGWLAAKLENLKKNLDSSEQKLVAYRNRENLLDVRGVETLAVRELDDVSNKLSIARQERVEIESVYMQIEEISKPTIQQYESIPEVFDSSVAQRAKDIVVAAQTRVIELSKRYGQKHPEMQVAMANYKKARINYAKVIKNIIKRIKKQYLIAKSNERRLNQELSRTKSEIRNINKKSYKLNELEREVDANRQLYETFLKRFKETNETKGLDSANARIIDTAFVSKDPIKPKKKLMVIVTFIFSMVLGLVYAFVSEALNRTFRSPGDIESRLSIPLLGVLPQTKNKSVDKEKGSLLLPFIDDNHSAYAESIRTIRSSMILSNLDSQSKIILVTSSVPDEGKTTFSLNLAIAFGQTEKVLLIDVDLRKPSLAKMCDINASYGLINIISGDSDAENTIHRYEKWSVDILPAGKILHNPQELLGSKKFAQMLADLSKEYDRIILDSAPVLAVADALVLSQYANEVVYIVKSDATTVNLVRSGVDKLKNLNVSITGGVLSHFNTKNTSKFSNGGYYESYYHDYGYNS